MGNCCNCRPNIPESEHEIQSSQISESEEIQAVKSNEEIEMPQLTLNIKTWQKESYSLFDYENTQHIKSQTFIIREEGLLFSKNNEIFWQQGVQQKREEQSEFTLMQLELCPDNSFTLVNLRFPRRQVAPETEEIQNKYDLSTIKQQEEVSNQPEPQQSDNQSVIQIPEQKLYFQNKFSINTKVSEKGSKIWLVVRSIQQKHQTNGLRLIEGDHIKLGRVKLIVKCISLQITKLEQLDENELSENSIYGEDSVQCRVCLSTSKSFINPLINPCRCSGSMKYIHLNCLIKWLRQRAHSHCTDECIIFIWKNLECELCKFIYPPVFKSDDKMYDLVELSKPKNQPYIILEFYQKKPPGDHFASNLSSGIYILLFNKKKCLRIGRAQDVEININDISVSRLHANLKMVEGVGKKHFNIQIGNNVFIADKKSKFGTLLLLKQSINLSNQLEGLEMQVSRSLIQFNIQQEKDKDVPKGNFEKLLGREDQEEVMIN